MKTPSDHLPTPRPSFRVGDWEAQQSLNRLRRSGQTVQLEPKVMEVLAHLATQAPEVVSRDALLEAVWGTAHVSEDLPRRAVYELRKALTDDARRPSYIETIPRAGYRLVAPVTWPAAHAARQDASEDDPDATETAPEATLDHAPDAFPPSLGRQAERGRLPPVADRQGQGRSHGRGRVRSHGPRTGQLAALLFLVVVALSLLVLRGMRSPEPVPPRISPLTSQPGVEYDPSLSPDGHRVAFLRAADTESASELHLHTQLIDGGPSLRLSQQAADFDHPIESPTWSPDGSRIAYLRWNRRVGWSIYTVPSLGGPERKILELGRPGASGLAWSPNGDAFAVGLRRDEGGPFLLHRVDLAEPTPENARLDPLTQPPPSSVGDQLPAWAPDGRRLAFLRTLAPDASQVWLFDLRRGEAKAVLDKVHKIADLDWSSDGRHLVLAVLDAGIHRLWSLDVATGRTNQLPSLGEATRWLSIARSGERLVYGRSRFEYSVWQIDPHGGAPTRLPHLSSTFFDQGLDLSPDGSRLAFASTRSGSFEIWISDLDGRRALRLSDFRSATAGHPRWLDPEKIVFHADPESHFDLFLAEADGAAPQPLTTHTSNDRAPSTGSDGRTIYFASDRSGDWQIWQLRDQQAPQRLTRNGGYYGQESPDGRWLYFTRWQSAGLWRLPLDGLPEERGQEEQVLADEPRAWEWGNWAVRPEGIHVVTRDPDNRVFLTLFAFGSGETLGRVELPATPVQPSLTFFPGSGTALLVGLDRVESDLVLVEGSLPAL